MVQFLHDGMRTSNLGVRIKEVMVYRLWSSGIGSVSNVVYLQLNDSQRLTMQKSKHKDLGTLDVIEDARSNGNAFAGNSKFSYLHYF
jgi:hypothetical protein